MNPSTPPKGSLEDLFRHHLLESEAAAVPPRPQVWEQVDNSLLLAQNEKYRRRLAAYRWAVAASLLLASLAGGGWWHSQRPAPATGTLARATTQPAADQTSLAVAHRPAATMPAARTPATVGARPTAKIIATPSYLSTTRTSAIDQTTTLLASTTAGLTSAAAKRSATTRQPHRPAYTSTLAERLAGPAAFHTQAGHAFISPGNAIAMAELAVHNAHWKRRRQPAKRSFTTSEAASLPGAVALAATATPATQAAGQSYSEQAMAAAAAVPATTTLVATADATPSAEATLAARLARLAPPAASLPTTLAEVAVAAGPPLELTRRWQYGASYSASAYNPNIEWAKAPVVVAASNAVTAYQPPTDFTRSVAAEYRTNLHAGLGQRLSLWATRRLGNGRWGLRTGVELTQNNATSASSVAFVGEPVADLSYLQAGQAVPMQRTSYRYRSVSVPAELRYANPIKTGFSFYGRIGAMVTALLNVRSEVEGTPEASRTYAPLAGDTPYRRVSAGLRGGAGMQYRPAGHQWSLNIGPVAEMGILSLNANAGQGFWNQQRPYSFGLEAGMEIGRGFRLQ